MLWLTDAEGKVVFSNSKRNTFLGVVSERATLASDAWIKALHPDDLELCMKTSMTHSVSTSPSRWNTACAVQTGNTVMC